MVLYNIVCQTEVKLLISIKIRRCGKIANETTLQKRSNDTKINIYSYRSLTHCTALAEKEDIAAVIHKPVNLL